MSPKNKNTFISGCDANYFPLLCEWLKSVRRFPQSQTMDICILDAGLSPDQVAYLKPLVANIVRPDWPVAIPASKIGGREYLKACVCRPFIPSLFPGYETYMWMDADTWVQDWASIDLFLQGAARKKIALTAQVDRAYPRAARVKWLGPWPWKVRSFYFSNAIKAYGLAVAKKLLTHHVLLAGAFALDVDAPHWKRWQEITIQTLKKGKIFTAEQLSLGILCHIEDYPYEALPAWAHWLCEFTPAWDQDRQMFVEPFLPHMPIGILHLSGVDASRDNPDVNTVFKTLSGGVISKPLRFQT